MLRIAKHEAENILERYELLYNVVLTWWGLCWPWYGLPLWASAWSCPVRLAAVSFGKGERGLRAPFDITKMFHVKHWAGEWH